MKAPRGYLNNTFIKWSAMLGWLDLVNTKPEIPDNIEVFSDLEFKKTEHRTLLLDIYRKKSINSSTPLIVFIHGGSWTKGNKKDYLIYLLSYAEKGYITSYKIPQDQLRQLPNHIYGIPIHDTTYQWYAATISSFGIMKNEELRQKLDLPYVTTWKDLTRYELRGRIGAADPRLSGSALMIYEIILQKYGWKNGLEVITKIGANVKGFLSGSTLSPKQLV